MKRAYQLQLLSRQHHEERILFPLAETYLTTETLDLIYQASADNVKRIDETR